MARGESMLVSELKTTGGDELSVMDNYRETVVYKRQSDVNSM